jgi:hypothetical protein
LPGDNASSNGAKPRYYGYGESHNISSRETEPITKRACDKEKKYFSKLKNWISFLTLIFVAVYTCITILIWCASREQVHISADQEYRQLRAYVGTNVTQTHPFGPDNSPKVDYYEISVVWKNTGNTPGINVYSALGARALSGDLPDDFDFPDNGKLNKYPTVNWSRPSAYQNSQLYRRRTPSN